MFRQVILSKLPGNTLLTVRHYYDRELDIMTRDDLLQGIRLGDIIPEKLPRVSLADRVEKVFDPTYINDMVERIADQGDVFEEWDLRILETIKDDPRLAAFVQMMQEAYDSHPIYTEGQQVVVDVLRG